MKLGVKLVILNLFIGMALLLVSNIPGIEINNINNTAYYGGFVGSDSFNKSDTGAYSINKSFADQFNVSVDATPPAENIGGFFNSVLNLATFGLYAKMMAILNKSIFALTGVLHILFDPLLGTNLSIILLGASDGGGIAQMIMSIIYTLTIFYLWTDKRFDGA
jgi:hypothetical protein